MNCTDANSRVLYSQSFCTSAWSRRCMFKARFSFALLRVFSCAPLHQCRGQQSYAMDSGETHVSRKATSVQSSDVRDSVWYRAIHGRRWNRVRHPNPRAQAGMFIPCGNVTSLTTARPQVACDAERLTQLQVHFPTPSRSRNWFPAWFGPEK